MFVVQLKVSEHGKGGTNSAADEIERLWIEPSAAQWRLNGVRLGHAHPVVLRV